MNYDQAIQEIIDVIKADKSIVQPWRNYALKSLNEAQAFIRMGKTTTNREPLSADYVADPPEGTPTKPEVFKQCICTLGMPPRKDCPVHGGKG